MGTKHTPGPWHRNIRSNGKYPVVFAGRNQHVAIVSQQHDGHETEANIDLVATAPELLEALIDAEFLLRKAAQVAGPMQDSFRRSAEDARVAIVKATGGKP
jgi:hypothetical protein